MFCTRCYILGAVLTAAFDRLFERLVRVFVHYHDVHRSPSNVPEIADARWDLELARAAIAVERDVITSRGATGSFMPRKVALSDDEVAELRVAGIGSAPS